MSRPSLAITLFAALAAFPAVADNALHGRFELGVVGASSAAYSLDATLGDRTRADALANFRLTWQPRWGNWDVAFHAVINGETGGGVPLARATASLLPSPPPATLFDLGDTLRDSGRTKVTARIDRLAVGYSTDHFVLRLGRQALTWGTGLTFHPMDIVDPFAPNATDTEYKPGVDMIYAQILFNDGSDLQAIAVPRRATSGGPVSGNASTFALHYHRSIGQIGASLMAARDHGDWTAGIGLSGPISGAAWNAEIVPTKLAAGGTRVSGLFNISNAMTLAGRNATFYAEYFRNGFGVSGSGAAVAALPTALTDRLVRGQLFTVSRDYLSLGMQIEWTPLLTVSPGVIANLDDGSLYATAEGKWSLSDNTRLVFGAQFPVGPRGTEFGGLSFTGAGAPYVAKPVTAYLQLRQYF